MTKKFKIKSSDFFIDHPTDEYRLYVIDALNWIIENLDEREALND